MNVMTVAPTVELQTKSGLVVARPANENDDTALTAFFEDRVTKDDLRYSFLSPIQHVTPNKIAVMTHMDLHQPEDFNAFAPDTDEIIANAVLAAD
jgi:hypothetical protein